MNYQKKLKDIPYQELTDLIIEIVNTTILDYGKRMDDDIQNHIIKRALEIMRSSKYSDWTWGDIVVSFDLGKTGQYGGESRMSVANIERWLNAYGKNRVEQAEEKKPSDLSTLTPEQRIESQWYAYAVHANIARQLAGGKRSASIRTDVEELKYKYDNDLSKLPKIPRANIGDKFRL